MIKQQSTGPGGFTGEFDQTFTRELTPILPKFCPKAKEEGSLPNSFYKTSITVVL